MPVKPQLMQDSVDIHIIYTYGSCDSQFPGSWLSVTLKLSMAQLHMIYVPKNFISVFTLHLFVSAKMFTYFIY